jgi:hypothetical protein
VQFNLESCLFVNLDVGVSYQSWTQGVAIADCNFTAVTKCVQVPSSQTGILSQLSIVNSQFAPNPSASGYAVDIRTSVVGVNLTNNLVAVGAGTTGFNIAAGAGIAISNNEIFTPGASTNVGIAIGASAGQVAISNNDVHGCTTGITVASGAAAVSIVGNNVTNNGTAITDSATGTFISNNAGYAWQSYTPTFGGFSANPTVSARYLREGKKVTVEIYTTANGTSNSTSFTPLWTIVERSPLQGAPRSGRIPPPSQCLRTGAAGVSPRPGRKAPHSL